MHKMLLPFDGSENALRALHYAIRLAKHDGRASIHLVHAHEEPLIYGEIAVYVSREKMAQLQRAHSEGVLAAAKKLLEEAGVAHTTDVLVGPVAESIAKCAEDTGCDSIVMGTRGLSAIENLLMGSVATKVTHLATMPVTLVK